MNKVDYKQLKTSEKILLVEEIWDSIEEDEIVLKDEHKKLLDERLEILKKNSKSTSWEDIKEKVRTNYKNR